MTSEPTLQMRNLEDEGKQQEQSQMASHKVINLRLIETHALSPPSTQRDSLTHANASNSLVYVTLLEVTTSVLPGIQKIKYMEAKQNR